MRKKRVHPAKILLSTGKSRYEYLNEVLSILSSEIKAQGVEHTLDEILDYNVKMEYTVRTKEMVAIQNEVNKLLGRVSYRVGMNMYMKNKRQLKRKAMDERLKNVPLVDEFKDGRGKTISR